jgi:hypothetical protein
MLSPPFVPSAEKSAGTVTATYIGGTCVPMTQGVLDLTLGSKAT